MTRNQRSTARKLDRVFEESPRFPFDPKTDRVVIFSDLHLADHTPGIDDFQRNEMIFCHALQRYDEMNWRLVLNGDVEEGWEVRPSAIRETYRDTVYAMERKFADKGPEYHMRTVGNHDDIWNKPHKVVKHLWPVLGEISVYPGIRLGDDIFITHGHQGDVFSDTAAVLGMFAVRHGWKWLQRGLKISTARAATNHLIRRSRDDALYRWAHSRRKLLFAGHTHRSMFGDVPDGNELVTLLRKLESELPVSDEPFQVRAMIEHLRKVLQSSSMKGDSANPLPCYFNSGCCVHTDGITGIELDRGKIRLVHWGLERSLVPGVVETAAALGALRIERKVYREADLGEILNQIRADGEPDTSGKEHSEGKTENGVTAAA